MEIGDIVLIKTEEEFISAGYSKEAVQERKQFIGKFAIVSSIITTTSGGFFYIRHDKKSLKWFKDMISERSSSIKYFTDKIKNYCNNYCIQECSDECPLKDIKDILNEYNYFASKIT